MAKLTTTLALAAAAALGALSFSAAPADARPGFHGGKGGFRGGFHVRHHGWHGRHWGHHHGWRWRHRYAYGAPLVVGASYYASDCYFVRRYGRLFKVCE